MRVSKEMANILITQERKFRERIAYALDRIVDDNKPSDLPMIGLVSKGENNPIVVSRREKKEVVVDITEIRDHKHKIRYSSSCSSKTQKPSTDSMVNRKFLPYTLVIKNGQVFTRPKNINPTSPLISDEQRQLIIPLEKNEALPYKKRPFFQTQNNNNNNKRRKKIMKKTSGTTVFVHNPPPPPPPTPELPQDFKEKIAKLRGSEPVLIIEKRLFKSDVDKQQNRFSFPVKQVKSEFLTLEEKTFLDSPNQEIGVRVIDPGLREWSTIDLNKWDMNKSFNYVLISKWNELISKNGLKEGTVVQLWSFRVDDHLWFALVKPRPKE